MDKPSDILVGLVVFSMILAGISLYLTNIATNSGREISDMSSLSQFQKVNAKMEEVKEELQNIKAEDNPLSLALGVVKGAWSVISTIVFWIPSAITELLGGIAEVLPIPAWLQNGIIALLLIFTGTFLLKVLLKMEV